MAELRFIGPSHIAAADQVVAAIHARDWPMLSALLAATPDAAGRIEPWERPEGPPAIAGQPEVQTIPELMLRYPGKVLVRYDTPDERLLYKLEVVVEPAAGGFRVIDFWGLGW